MPEKIGMHSGNASTQNSKGSKTISWTYRIIIKSFSDFARPLNALTRKNVPF